MLNSIPGLTRSAAIRPHTGPITLVASLNSSLTPVTPEVLAAESTRILAVFPHGPSPPRSSSGHDPGAVTRTFSFGPEVGVVSTFVGG